MLTLPVSIEDPVSFSIVTESEISSAQTSIGSTNDRLTLCALDITQQAKINSTPKYTFLMQF